MIYDFTLLDLCVSSLRRGHANLLCIVPILTDDPRRKSFMPNLFLLIVYGLCVIVCLGMAYALLFVNSVWLYNMI